MQLLDETVKTAVTAHLQALEAHFEGDVVFYYGSIDSGVVRPFRDFVEKMADATTCKRKRLIFFLNSPGVYCEAQSPS